MKTFYFTLPTSPPLFITVFALATLTAAPAQAENPFKFLRSKAKQGISKVARAVNPKRIGTAIKNVVVEPAPNVSQRRVTQPVEFDDGTLLPDGTTYYPSSPSDPRWNATEIPPRNTTSRDLYRSSTAQDPGVIRGPVPPIRDSHPSPTSPPEKSSTGSRNLGSSGKLSPMPRGQKPVPSSATDPEAISPATPLEGTPSAGPKTAPSSAARQDLPFGELVPGKTGFVYSPYSTKELVDVSGIPTGTKVKCPYSGKTFRVP